MHCLLRGVFGCEEIEYLGHLVSAKGVSAYPSKIKLLSGYYLSLLNP